MGKTCPSQGQLHLRKVLFYAPAEPLDSGPSTPPAEINLLGMAHARQMVIGL
jgi:hypothetical protein